MTSCGMYAVYSLSASAIDKDKGDTPAAEKATQGIEVDQKSKTVKLAKEEAFLVLARADLYSDVGIIK